MTSILGDETGPGPSRCLLLLQRSLAIQLTRGPPSQLPNANQRESPKEHPADEMWMYDKGYNLFQVRIILLFLLLSFLFYIYDMISSPFIIANLSFSINSHQKTRLIFLSSNYIVFFSVPKLLIYRNCFIGSELRYPILQIPYMGLSI